MGTIATAINPRKLFRFAIESEGIQTAYVQKVKIPKIELKSAKHGNGPFTVNTVSRVEFGQLELEMLKPSENSLVWWKDWVALIINLGSGAMTTPDIYKKTLLISEYAADGVTLVDLWECQGCYPVDIDMTDLDKLSDNNAIDKLKFNIDKLSYSGSGDIAIADILGTTSSVLGGL